MTISNEHDRGHAAANGRGATDEERRKATLYVASHARNVDDCRDLLEALGLVDQGFRWVTRGPHGPRKKVTE